MKSRKTAEFGGKGSVVSLRQCISSHISYHDDQYRWVKARIVSSRTPFARFSPLETLKNCSVIKYLPTMKRWSLQLMDILRNSTVFTINRTSKLFNIAGKNYRIKLTLCWEIKLDFSKFFVFFIKSGTSEFTLVCKINHNFIQLENVTVYFFNVAPRLLSYQELLLITFLLG